MVLCRALIALLLCGAAVHAEELLPLIARPITLPADRLDLTVNGTYTNWSTPSAEETNLGPLEGETLVLGADFGATDRVQPGLAAALPVHPGAGFGSVVASVALAVHRNVALRFDVGYERIGLNGDNTATFSHTNRYFGGIGVPIKIPIGPSVAFVAGRTGAVQFGQFENIGFAATGNYVGSQFPGSSSDFLIVSGGNNDSGTIFALNLPAGLLLQPDPHLALTLQAGYAVASTSAPPGRLGTTTHFIPVGLEAVVTPVQRLDLGARFFVDGYVAQSGSAFIPGYFDLRTLTIWLRVHA
jgi:hypothetical protein